MSNYLNVFSPIIGLAVNAVSSICIFRYSRKVSLLKSLFIAFGLGISILLIIDFWAFFNGCLASLSNIFVNIITYSALSYCYFHFVNLGETARRVRILRELYDSKEGLSMKEILERYNAKEIIEIRMKRLINNGQVVVRNGRYYIGGGAVLFMARVIDAMKSMLLRKS